MPKPKGSTPAGDASLHQGGGDRRMKGEKQLPRIAEKELEKTKEWMKKVTEP